MGFWKLNKQVRTGLGLALLLAALPAIVLAQEGDWLTPGEALARARPCSCHPGIEQIENFRKETHDSLNAWQSVEQYSTQASMTNEQQRSTYNNHHIRQIDEELFGGCAGMHGKIGRIEGTPTPFGLLCEARVAKSFVDCACDIIVESTIVHEETHCRMWSWLGFGASLAGSEVAAHEAQQEFLDQALEDLRRMCRPKPTPSSRKRKEREEAKQDVANAAKRAGQYANAIH